VPPLADVGVGTGVVGLGVAVAVGLGLPLPDPVAERVTSSSAQVVGRVVLVVARKYTCTALPPTEARYEPTLMEYWVQPVVALHRLQVGVNVAPVVVLIWIWSESPQLEVSLEVRFITKVREADETVAGRVLEFCQS
jgi:hypothetical protein